MQKYFLLLATLLLQITFSEQSLASTEIKVMSFNTMCKLCDFHKDYGPFDERLNNMVDTITRHKPDLIAVQELQSSRHARALGNKLNDEYAILYRKFVLWPGTDSVLMVKKSRFEILDHHGEWLGPKGPKFNLGWTRRTPRKVEVARLKDRQSQFEFMFLGLHFDSNLNNRTKSAEYVSAMVEKMDLPVILAGDSNIEPTTDAFNILLGNKLIDSFVMAPTISYATNSQLDEKEACSDNVSEPFPNCRIDHIFYSKNSSFTVKDWIVDLYKYHQNKWHVSDHRAVMSTLVIP